MPLTWVLRSSLNGRHLSLHKVYLQSVSFQSLLPISHLLLVLHNPPDVTDVTGLCGVLWNAQITADQMMSGAEQITETWGDTVNDYCCLFHTNATSF